MYCSSAPAFSSFSAHRVFIFHILRDCAFFSLDAFHLHVFSYNIDSLQFGLPIFRCPPTSIFHALITTPSHALLSTCPNHLCCVSLMFYLMFAAPVLALIYSVLVFSILIIPIIIHLNILRSVLSSNSCSSCLNAHFRLFTYNNNYLNRTLADIHVYGKQSCSERWRQSALGNGVR